MQQTRIPKEAIITTNTPREGWLHASAPDTSIKARLDPSITEEAD